MGRHERQAQNHTFGQRKPSFWRMRSPNLMPESCPKAARWAAKSRETRTRRSGKTAGTGIARHADAYELLGPQTGVFKERKIRAFWMQTHLPPDISTARRGSG